jgi:hypothetical protein
MTAKLYSLVEKLFVMLLAGTCAFAVAYLRDINLSLTEIKERTSIACEQISAIDSGLKELKVEMSRQKDLIDYLHPRKG